MNDRRHTIVAFTLLAAALSLTWDSLSPETILIPTPADEHRERPDGAAPVAELTPEPVAASPAARPEVAAREKRKTWLDDRVMVRVADEEIDALAARYGVTVLRRPGRAGLGAVSLPAGESPHGFADRVREDGLAWAGRVGTMHGASPFPQYHLDAVSPPASTAALPSIVVAVLDTGVAYENHNGAGGPYVAAPTMNGVAFVDPWDFVNDDAHANDDHHHGTHIASIIASDSPTVSGVAPSVGIMPVKVLDHNNSGNELDLIDGIMHAVDHGADVINMSLSFELDYVLSGPLGDALQYAHDEGVVMVAAAGNEGANQVTYPAAYPPVIGVVASSCDAVAGCSDLDSYRVAPYSNRGPGADVIAPGGNLDIDADGDGVPEGILAQTFADGNPAQMGWYMMAGTSQAAAVVSGAAAHILAAGGDVDGIVAPLRFTALGGDPDASWQDYNVVATPQIDDSVAGLGNFSANVDPVHVTLMPYLTHEGGAAYAPHFRVLALDADGDPMAGAMVYGTMLGGGAGLAHCMTNAAGVCTIDGVAGVSTGNTGWALQIDAVVDHNWNLRDPLLAMFATDGVEAIVDAMANGTVLGFHWAAGTYPGVGDVEEAYVAFNNGSGLTTSPMGLIMPPNTLASLGSLQFSTLNFAQAVPWADASTSQLTMTVADFGGQGLTSSPFGFVPMHIPVFNGDDDGGTSSFGGGWLPVSVSGTTPIASSTWMGNLGLQGSHLGNKLGSGGWMDASSVQPASALMGPDGLGIAPTATGSASRPQLEFQPTLTLEPTTGHTFGGSTVLPF